MFAPRLKIGDKVIYITVKGRYQVELPPHWRLVAILEVVHRFETHLDAAAWYNSSNLPLPNNCLVKGNPYMPYEMTGGASPEKFGNAATTDELIRRWDLSYQLRARKHGVFLACRAEYLELKDPPIITAEVLTDIFGRIPPTLTPPPITDHEYQSMRSLVIS